ncbi:putative O-glycosylation ligase, exosortase A system-associated [Sedimenticola selenatireducens]|uniref:Putative O-glycosylation ligase, exosortase A system-associated n=1 Tax=Sedimenticola selenatireducens TaxID=191960 RepID=A0A557S8E6_9GAMM|nr:putative O-glycosylation ligase, exosortase A system-associated [Sedimenticola selenatireducens]TVO73581.1 putative O-glycosylation ligase, exosortase A system-associated [Sedimenticola selenatireducens]TVT63521.1 MAG: putative O-glycosylation ligase, exosortase A system-associated [Sedimenticola selenatireducens]
MRDLLLVLIVFGSLPLILKQPYIGVLVWSWISYMNPHKLAWGFAKGFPFAYIVAIVLCFSIVFSRERLRIPRTGLTVLWGIFLFWMCITTLFSIFPEYATDQLIKVLKIQLVTIFTVMLMTSRRKIDLLVWVIVLSIGFYGVKGGIFTLLAGGEARVWGPAGSFIQENNSLALALLMILPLIYYLYLQAKNIWIKRGLLFSMPIVALSIFGSQSRGALIGIVAMGLFMVMKSKQKVLAFMAIIIIGVFGFMFMPQQWHDRMSTIEEYEQDASAMGRINAWKYSINVANDRITGAGFDSWSSLTFAQYAPDPDAVHAAHSIYFGVLADHGWIGLLLWLGILVAAWRSNSWIIRNARDHHQLSWAVNLARMLQVSMISYGSAGAFLSLSYFDLPWHIIAIIVLVKEIVKKTLVSGGKEKEVLSQTRLGV